MQLSSFCVQSTFALVLLLVACHSQAQTAVKLWPGIAPGSEHWAQKEVVARNTPVGTVAINVVTPTLTPYLPPPDKATGVGIVIAPGGYCVALALSAEGSDVARWLQKQGIAAFVLKYRTQEKRGQGIPSSLNMDHACKFGIEDGIQAIKLVRKKAKTWGVAPDHVGIMGFSAGGMIASGVLLQKDTAARPDFTALIYGAPFGTSPAVPAKMPPIFMAWAQDDVVGRDAVAKFYDALVLAGNKPEAHIYGAGGHGFALKKQGTASDHWPEEFIRWLQSSGFKLDPQTKKPTKDRRS